MARGGSKPQPTITPDSSLGGTEIERSLRFQRGDSAYLSRSVGTTGNRRTFTISFWAKFCDPQAAAAQRLFSTDGGNGNGDIFKIEFYGGAYAPRQLAFLDNNHAGSGIRFTVNRNIRDATSWYHVVFSVDTTQGTASDRVKIYINGEQESEFLDNSTHNHQPDQNYDTCVNLSGKTTTWGRSFAFGSSSAVYSDMYLAEAHLIDGYQYDASYFGFTDPQTGIWMPKRYEGTYGTNGFYLDFSDNSSTSTLGIDKSPNGNDFASTNLAVSDVMIDTPSNNFPTFMNVLPQASASYSEGNLFFDESALSGEPYDTHKTAYGTMSLKSGKWYWEGRATTIPGTNTTKWTYGVSDIENTKNAQLVTVNYLLAVSSGTPSNATYAYGDAVSIYKDAKKKNGSHAGNIDGYTIAAGDVVGIALDVDAGKVWYRIGDGIGGSQTPGSWLNGVTNNTYNSTTLSESGHDATLTTGEVYVPAFAAESCGWIANFGQDSSFAGNETAQGNKDENGQGDFYYAVPRGFKAICSKNLPPNVPSIRPQKHFDTITYTGTDTSAARTITGLEFTPDFIWQKRRNGENWNTWHDTVRGVGKTLYSNGTGNSGSSGQTTNNQYGYISAFGTNGFTWSPGSTNNSDGNETNGTFASWCWKAGGAAVSNSDGSVTSSVSANQEAGFSIVKWTTQSGAYTVGHGLGRTPEMIMSIHLSNTGTS